MNRFNKFDLHDQNVSEQRLREIIKDIGYKYEEGSENLTEMLSKVNTKLSTLLKEYKFLKKELIGSDEINNIEFDTTSFNDAIFSMSLKKAVIELLSKEGMDIFIRSENQKRLDALYRELIEIKNESDRIHAANSILLNEAMHSLQQRQAIYNDFLLNTQNRINTLKAEAENIKGEIELLQKMRAKAIQDASIEIANDLNKIKTNDGKQLFDGVPEENKQAFCKDLFERIMKNERNAEAALTKLDTEYSVLENRKNDLHKQIKAEKEKTPIQKGSSGNHMIISFSGKQSSYSLTQEIDKIEKRQKEILSEKGTVREELKRNNEKSVLLSLEAAKINPNILEKGISASDLVNIIQDFDSFKSHKKIVEEIDEKVHGKIQRLEGIEEELAALKENILEVKNSEGVDDLENIEDLDDLLGDIDDLMGDIDETLEEKASPKGLEARERSSPSPT